MPGLLVGARMHMPAAVTQRPPLAQDLGTVPADVPRPPVPLLEWPWDREPSFLAWLHYAGDAALTSWVAARFGRVNVDCAWEPAVPHVVYLIRSATPRTFYVGISSNWPQRLAAHQRATRRVTRTRPGDLMPGDAPDELRAYRMDAWEAFDMRHGFDRVEHIIVVPDKVCALLAEVLWTCMVAGAGFTVFGHDTFDLCPASAWLERAPWWDRNTVKGRPKNPY